MKDETFYLNVTIVSDDQKAIKCISKYFQKKNIYILYFLNFSFAGFLSYLQEYIKCHTKVLSAEKIDIKKGL